MCSPVQIVFVHAVCRRSGRTLADVVVDELLDARDLVKDARVRPAGSVGERHAPILVDLMVDAAEFGERDCSDDKRDRKSHINPLQGAWRC